MDKLLFNCYIGYFLLCSLLVVHGKELSCNQTPYPQVCKHYIDITNTLSTLDASSSSFHDMALKVTMVQAIEAHKLVSIMELNNFKDKRAKSAWEDCLELYEDTIHHLNHSMRSNNLNDKLTWQSTSIANHQTCQNGFIEFNLPSHLNYFPSMLSNFSKLLSNSLSISKAVALSSSSLSSTKQIGGRKLLSDGFPHWLSASDRRLLQATEGTPKADIVVAQDGTGNYKTISEGVAVAAKLKGKGRVVLHVKAGVYRESVDIKKIVKNLMIIGDGIDATIVTGNHNAQDGSTTFRSATFAVSGEGFIAKDITFENTAGPQKHQAVALRSGADHSVFYRCSFKGYQDTLYVYSQRQFYRECDIYGTIDFIFGDAVTVLQNCNIYVRKPMSNQQNTVTAQGRTDPNENTGIIIHNCHITSSGDLKPVQSSFRTFLGRPWQKYSRTVVMKSNLDGLINPAGWSPWNGNFALSTLYYGEYMNTGPGANTERRVKLWPGFRVITDPTEAVKFSVGNFLAGDSWIPGSGVPFDVGL
ncbi:pectinesterase-like [Gastrolobium bilobum]|uniref:pectinesterase-like n=1 Tax=Gastrolobium bilobum TaxID=150636 RepID=UPI002AB16792|nr:pectinesterase-like [Gastrolobium bilobum]